MGFEPDFSVAAPATCPVVLRARIRRCRLPTGSPRQKPQQEEEQVRAIGLDVHRDFCEVAIVAHGELRSAGRIDTTPQSLELFGQSLGSDDRVVLEVTGGAWEIARLIEPHVARVVVVSPHDTGIRQARARRLTASMRGRSRSCSPRARSTRCGCPMKPRGSCAGGSGEGVGSCVRALPRRTRSTPV